MANPVHDENSAESFRTLREAGVPVVVVDRPIKERIIRAQFVLDDRRCGMEAA